MVCDTLCAHFANHDFGKSPGGFLKNVARGGGDELAAVARQVRRWLFFAGPSGAPFLERPSDPPFAQEDDAARWIREEAVRGHGPDYGERCRRFNELVGAPIAEIQRLSDELTIPVSIDVTPVRLFFRDGRGNVESVDLSLRAASPDPVSEGDMASIRLWTLRGQAWVLAVLQSDRWRASDPRLQADATMLLLVGRPAPKPLSRGRKKGLALLGVVAGHGEPPKPPGRRGVDVGERSYWQSVAADWNEHEAPRFAAGSYAATYHWISAKRRYEELRRRGLMIPPTGLGGVGNGER